jgi:hypothetical protein
MFTEFRGKKFLVLWRCDGCRNKLIVIMDLDGNIFDGFTSLAWANVRRDERQIADKP